jgi:hypothetical protein
MAHFGPLGPTVVLIGVLTLGACASSSSGNGPSGEATGGFPAPQTTNFITIDPPSPATKGAAPAGPFAIVGGPQFDFDGDDNHPVPAAGTSFPLLQSVITLRTSGLAADDATMAAGATVTMVDAYQVRLQIPNLGIDVVTAPYLFGGPMNLWTEDGWSVMGRWSDPSDPTHTGVFLFGYPTNPDSVPVGGTATYGPGTNVRGFVAGPNGVAQLVGDGSLTINFVSGAVTGIFTKMRAGTEFSELEPYALPFNDVAINGVLTGNQLAATTSATSTPGSIISLSGTASGFFNGELYGPNAESAKAVWTLSDGTSSALGAFEGYAP